MSSNESPGAVETIDSEGDQDTEDDNQPEPDPVREGLLSALGERLGDSMLETHVVSGQDAWVRVKTESWQQAGEVVRGPLGMTYLDFLSGMDWMESPYGRSEDSGDLEEDQSEDQTDEQARDGASGAIKTGYAGGDSRFQVFARVSNVYEHTSLTLKVDVPDMALASWVPNYAGAAWHEREAAEMFGISFDGHPDLRALYLPSGFEGNPLRKDFPLLARHIKPWPGLVDVEPMPGEDDKEEGS